MPQNDEDTACVSLVNRVDGVSSSFERLILVAETLHGGWIVLDEAASGGGRVIADVGSVSIARGRKGWDGRCGGTRGVDGMRLVLLWVVRRECDLR